MSKKIHTGWAMMRLNRAGNWEAVNVDPLRDGVIQDYQTWFKGLGSRGLPDYKDGCRAGTLRIVKMFVEM